MADDAGAMSLGALRQFLNDLKITDDAEVLIEGYDERDGATVWLTCSRFSVEIGSDGAQTLKLHYTD